MIKQLKKIILSKYMIVFIIIMVYIYKFFKNMSYKKQSHHIQQNSFKHKISHQTPIYQSTMSAEQKHSLIMDSVTSSLNM
jgi:hypothetical protein